MDILILRATERWIKRRHRKCQASTSIWPHHDTAQDGPSGQKIVRDWKFDGVSLGYPCPIINGHPLREPHKLGGGWVGFNFRKAFGCPTKIINDATMQALGSYKGGRMVFFGLGTGLGSATMVNGMLEPMELAHLTYKHGKTYEDYLALRGLERSGKKKWRQNVAKITKRLKTALKEKRVPNPGPVRKVSILVLLLPLAAPLTPLIGILPTHRSLPWPDQRFASFSRGKRTSAT